jgi:hypothetical protein
MSGTTQFLPLKVGDFVAYLTKRGDLESYRFGKVCEATEDGHAVAFLDYAGREISARGMTIWGISASRVQADEFWQWAQRTSQYAPFRDFEEACDFVRRYIIPPAPKAKPGRVQGVRRKSVTTS